MQLVIRALLLHLFQKLKSLQKSLNSQLNFPKERYYTRVANKLCNVEKSSKTNCLLLKRFLNNEKIPIIPPRSNENKFVRNFKEKKVFNTFFVKHCFLRNTQSEFTFSNLTIGTLEQNVKYVQS